MDLHPIFVHFPIAILTLYAIAELATWGKLRTHTSWFFTKALLVIVGAVSTVPALLSGDVTSHEKRAVLDRALVHTHESYAQFTTFVFCVIAAVYLVSLVYTWTKWTWLAPIAKITDWILASRTIMIILALIGLALVTITGALGGAIVYGPTADPIVQFIYNLVM